MATMSLTDLVALDLKLKFEDAADQGKVNVAGTAMNEIYAEAIRRGIPSATAMRVILRVCQ